MKKNPRVSGSMEAEIGARIRATRQSVGMSQDELGTRLGITFQQIQKYEKGTNRVAASRLIGIAKVLGVPVLSLLPSEDPQGENAAVAALMERNTALEAKLAAVRQSLA